MGLPSAVATGGMTDTSMEPPTAAHPEGVGGGAGAEVVAEGGEGVAMGEATAWSEGSGGSGGFRWGVSSWAEEPSAAAPVEGTASSVAPHSAPGGGMKAALPSPVGRPGGSGGSGGGCGEGGAAPVEGTASSVGPHSAPGRGM